MSDILDDAPADQVDRDVLGTDGPSAAQHGDDAPYPALDESGSGAPSQWGQVAVVSALLLATTAASVVYWPGQIDPDTVDELREAATGKYADWHSPLVSALWRIPYLLGFHSPGWVLAVAVFSLLVGLYLIVRIRFGRALSTVLAIICLAYPPVLSWTIHVGRDAWFIAGLVGAMGFAARAARMGRPSWRVNLPLSLVLALVCSASRQNGILVVCIVFATWAALLMPATLSHRRPAIAGTAVLASVLVLGIQMLIQRELGTLATHPEQALYEYDLAQLSQQEGVDLFPASVRIPHRNTMAAIRQVQTGTYDTLVWGRRAVIKPFLDASNVDRLRRAWEHAVLHDPGGYVRERSALLGAELSITRPSAWVFEPSWANKLPPVSPTLEHAGEEYFQAFAVDGNNAYGGPLYTVWVYVLILAAAVPVLVRRRTRPDWVAAALCGALFVEVGTLFFFSPDLLYRFAYPLVVGGVVMVPVLVPRRPSRRTGPDWRTGVVATLDSGDGTSVAPAPKRHRHSVRA
jgi:hypothetical protein